MMEERLKADFFEALDAAENALIKLAGRYEDEGRELDLENVEQIMMELQDLGKIAEGPLGD